jgi:hypothetical protein
LFTVEEDYQVGERTDGFDAVGAGRQIALGAFFGQADNLEIPGIQRVLTALKAASLYSAYVRAPFILNSIKIPKAAPAVVPPQGPFTIHPGSGSDIPN